MNRMDAIAEYQAWANMKARCSNKRLKTYPHYGGRGISVCAEWIESFDTFLADMGRRPSARYSLDRINNDGNYEPSNCRWATHSQQQSNKRRREKLAPRVTVSRRAGRPSVKRFCIKCGHQCPTSVEARTHCKES